jgi:polyisoprenoid-binding protein YceI
MPSHFGPNFVGFSRSSPPGEQMRAGYFRRREKVPTAARQSKYVRDRAGRGRPRDIPGRAGKFASDPARRARPSRFRQETSPFQCGTPVAPSSGGRVVTIHQAAGRIHMRSATLALAGILAATLTTAPYAAARIAVSTAKVTVNGNSTLHPWTASSSTVKVTGIELAAAGEGDALQYALEPGALTAFDVAIPVRSLSSPKDGIDKNMHKALKAEQHADIRFRLKALDKTASGHRAVGLLTIAGVEKEVALDLQVQRKDETLAVTGTTAIVMTDFGVTPPKAMMGMIKTDPKVQITFELLLGA